MQSHINVGFGTDITIRDLAQTIAKVVGFEGKIEFDSTKPDGAPRKFLDCSLLNRLGWSPKVQLEAGLKIAYANFVNSNG
jgi:GDP-L-fucose synthase